VHQATEKPNLLAMVQGWPPALIKHWSVSIGDVRHTGT
jgi:hypothetical protein